MFCLKPDKTVASFLEITWKREGGGAVITIFLKYGKSNGSNELRCVWKKHSIKCGPDIEDPVEDDSRQKNNQEGP